MTMFRSLLMVSNDSERDPLRTSYCHHNYVYETQTTGTNQICDGVYDMPLSPQVDRRQQQYLVRPIKIGIELVRGAFRSLNKASGASVSLGTVWDDDQIV